MALLLAQVAPSPTATEEGHTHACYNMSSGREGKMPAFMFYPADWLADAKIAAMEPAEEGCYIRLLCYDWREDGLPDDLDTLARYCRIDPITFQGYWHRLSTCFPQHPRRTGYLSNPRLLRMRESLSTKHRKLSKAGRAGAKKRWSKGHASSSEDEHVDSHATSHPKQRPLASDSYAVAVASASEDTVTNVTGSTAADLTREQLLTNGRLIGARYLPTVRRTLWAPDGKPPGGWTESREVQFIEQELLRKRRVSSDTLDYAYAGLGHLRARGELDYLLSENGGKLTSRVLLVGFGDLKLLYAAEREGRMAEDQLRPRTASLPVEGR